VSRARATHKLRFSARASRDKIPVVRAEAPQPTVRAGVATLRLYDVIDSWGGYWGVSAQEFNEALDALGDDVTEIRLHVNSVGGEVFEGIAMMNALRAHSARVVVVIDALAASAASFVALAGDEIVMAPYSQMMIHDAWGACVGNAEEMRDVASRLDQLSGNMASMYADRAGGTVDTWRAAMRAETWFSADEAVAAGLADRVGEADDTDDAELVAAASFDLSVFTYPGRAQAPEPVVLAAAAPTPPAAVLVGESGPELYVDEQAAAQAAGDIAAAAARRRRALELAEAGLRV
jgi:ATP-dependent protease ClpP protease subunit